MAKKKSDGFQSAAGLIRYFDTEDDKSIKVNPWLVVAMCVILVAVVQVLDIIFPT